LFPAHFHLPSLLHQKKEMWFWEADCNTQQTKELQTLRLKNFPVAGYCALAIFFKFSPLFANRFARIRDRADISGV